MPTCPTIKWRTGYLLVFIFCCVGTFVGIHLAVSKYFEYETITEFDANFDQRGSKPALNYCTPIRNLVNYEFISKKRRKKVTPSNIFEQLTVTEILEDSPRVWQILKECQMRTRGSQALTTFDQQSCLTKLLTTARYITNLNLCYSFLFKDGSDFKVYDHDITFDVKDPSIVESIAFNDAYLTEVKEFLIFYSPMDSSSTLKAFSKAARGHIQDPNYKKFGVRYYQVYKSNLEKPYKTNCKVRSKAGRISQCETEQSFSLFKMMPPSSYAVGGDFKLMDENWIQHNSEAYNQMRKMCNAKYDHLTECHDSLYISSIDETRRGESFEISLLLPSFPNMILSMSPKRAIFEVLADVCSILGIFWGMSCFGWQPFAVGHDEGEPEDASDVSRIASWFATIFQSFCGCSSKLSAEDDENGDETDTFNSQESVARQPQQLRHGRFNRPKWVSGPYRPPPTPPPSSIFALNVPSSRIEGHNFILNSLQIPDDASENESSDSNRETQFMNMNKF